MLGFFAALTLFSPEILAFLMMQAIGLPWVSEI
jgi:hypothetical protein